MSVRGGFRGALFLAAVAFAALLAACATYYVPAGAGRVAGLAATTGGYSDAAMRRLIADMDPAMLALARRHDPIGKRTDYWGRTTGWATLDIRTLPTLGVPIDTFDEARIVNAAMPGDLSNIRAADPFVLKAVGEERAHALQCLSQAVYFEAATEPLEGRQAVAQTVLNRLRHPGYPKSVCGVVYEGSLRATGCQFSFTCDGSLAHALVPSLWKEAQAVATQALGGYVFKDIGTATHYHADYVFPYWAPSLLKLRQIGAHIFYRWTGPAGEPRAFNGRYAGGETQISADVLTAIDERSQGSGLGDTRAAAAVARVAVGEAPVVVQAPGVDGMATMVAVPDPTAPGGQRLQATGTVASRRIPTADDIARINALLNASAAGAPPAPAAAGAPPP